MRSAVVLEFLSLVPESVSPSPPPRRDRVGLRTLGGGLTTSSEPVFTAMRGKAGELEGLER